MPNAPPNLIDAIRERMYTADVTQQDVARSLGVSQGHLSKILQRKVRISRKVDTRMKRYLGLDSALRTEPLRLEPNDVQALGASIMQNMLSVLTDLQRLCDGISRLVGKR
jgi:transcriptional regulator with XRE-family HTH domain